MITIHFDEFLGEIASNKYATTTPGFVNMSKCEIGWKGKGEITWKVPSDGKDKILDYSVHMAFKSEPATNTTKFVRIYCGPKNKCVILNSFLLSTYVHNVSTTDIICRIAARNNKGYGHPKFLTLLKGEFYPIYPIRSLLTFTLITLILAGECIRNVHVKAEIRREAYINSMKHFDVTQQP